MSLCIGYIAMQLTRAQFKLQGKNFLGYKITQNEHAKSEKEREEEKGKSEEESKDLPRR